MENHNVDAEIKKLEKTSNRATGCGCLGLLGVAGLFTYFAINKTSQPEMVLGGCMFGLLAGYGFSSYAVGVNRQIKNLKKKKQEKQK